MKYEVPIIYKGVFNFIVEADSVDDAKDKAFFMFEDGRQPVELGNEWESVESIGEPEPVEEN